MVSLGLVATLATMMIGGNTVSEAKASGSDKVGSKHYIVNYYSTISVDNAAAYTASDSSVTTKVTSWYMKKNKKTGKLTDPVKKTKSNSGVANVAFVPGKNYISYNIVSEHVAKYGGDKITRTTSKTY